eukprot:273653-Amphidinium_carterae.1
MATEVHDVWTARADNHEKISKCMTLERFVASQASKVERTSARLFILLTAILHPIPLASERSITIGECAPNASA